MRVEVCRQHGDWQRDADTGVNAVLPDVPRDDGEPPPPPVLVFDETRDDAVALGDIPETLVTRPLLVLNTIANADLEGTTENSATSEDRVQLLYRYVAPVAYELDDGAGGTMAVSFAQAIVHGQRTIRAAHHVVSAAILRTRDAIGPKRGAVELEEPPSVRYTAPQRDDQAGLFVLAAVFDQPAHDQWVRAGF